MEPLVSVIIPVYNVLPYIREALDSVLHQTWQRLEIFIVDDGSDDGSEAVCDEYRRDDRVIVIHQENRGLSGARNTGLDRMTGEYVAFLDSDDAFHPEMIQRMLEAVRRTGAELAVCGYEIRRSEGRLTGAGRTGKVSEVPETVLRPGKSMSWSVREDSIPVSGTNSTGRTSGKGCIFLRAGSMRIRLSCPGFWKNAAGRRRSGSLWCSTGSGKGVLPKPVRFRIYGTAWSHTGRSGSTCGG